MNEKPYRMTPRMKHMLAAAIRNNGVNRNTVSDAGGKALGKLRTLGYVDLIDSMYVATDAGRKYHEAQP